MPILPTEALKSSSSLPNNSSAASSLSSSSSAFASSVGPFDNNNGSLPLSVASVTGTATRLRTGTGIKAITKFDNSTISSSSTLNIPETTTTEGGTISSSFSSAVPPVVPSSSPSRSTNDIVTKVSRTTTTKSAPTTTPIVPSTTILSDNETMDTMGTTKTSSSTLSGARKRTNSKTKLGIETSPLPDTLIPTANATTKASSAKKESVTSGTKRKSMSTSNDTHDVTLLHTTANNDTVPTSTNVPLGDGLEALTVPMNPLPRLSKAGYTSYGGTYDYEIALVNTEDVPLCTGKPDAIIPGSELTEAEFSSLSTEEQKKQRRLIRNRLSAQMHRQRQRAHIDGMETQITELAVVIEEMRTRMAIARSKCTCGVCDDDLLFPSTLLSFQPPHVPGILGYTGPAGEKTEEVRRLVLRGILGTTGSAASTASTTGLISSRINYELFSGIKGKSNTNNNNRGGQNSTGSTSTSDGTTSNVAIGSSTIDLPIDLNDPNHPQHRKLSVTRRRGLIPFGTLRPSKQSKTGSNKPSKSSSSSSASSTDKLSRSDDGQSNRGSTTPDEDNDDTLMDNDDSEEEEEISYEDEVERSSSHSSSSHRTNSMNEDDTEELDEISTNTGTSETNHTINTNKLSQHVRERSNSRQLKTNTNVPSSSSKRSRTQSSSRSSQPRTGNPSSTVSSSSSTANDASSISSSSRSSRTPSGTTSPHPPHQQSRFIRSSSPTPPVDMYTNFLPHSLTSSASSSSSSSSRAHLTRSSAASGLHTIPSILEETTLLPPMMMGTGNHHHPSGSHFPLLSVRVPSFDSFQRMNSLLDDSTTEHASANPYSSASSSSGTSSTDPHGLPNLFPTSPVTVPVLSEADLVGSSTTTVTNNNPYSSSVSSSSHGGTTNGPYLQRMNTFGTTEHNHGLFSPPTVSSSSLLPTVSTVPSLPFASPDTLLGTISSSATATASSSSAILLSRPMALSDSSMLSVDMLDEETGNGSGKDNSNSSGSTSLYPSSTSPMLSSHLLTSDQHRQQQQLSSSSNDIDPFGSSSVTTLSSASSSASSSILPPSHPSKNVSSGVSITTTNANTTLGGSSNTTTIRFGSLGTLLTTGTIATLGMFGYLENVFVASPSSSSSSSTILTDTNDITYRNGHNNHHQHSYASSGHGRILRETDDSTTSSSSSVTVTLTDLQRSSQTTKKKNEHEINVTQTLNNLLDSLDTPTKMSARSSSSIHDQIILHQALSVLSSAAKDFGVDHNHNEQTKTRFTPTNDGTDGSSFIPSSSSSSSYSPYIHDMNDPHVQNSQWSWPYTMLWSHAHQGPIINGQLLTASKDNNGHPQRTDEDDTIRKANTVSVTVVNSMTPTNDTVTKNTPATVPVSVPSTSSSSSSSSSSLGFDLPITTRGISLRASKSDPSSSSSSSAVAPTHALPVPVPVRIDLGKVANAGKKLGLALAHMVGVSTTTSISASSSSSDPSIDTSSSSPALPFPPSMDGNNNKDDEFMQSVLRLFNQEQPFTTEIAEASVADDTNDSNNNNDTRDSTGPIDHTLIMQHELNHALQAYANAALQAYRKAQIRLARNNMKKSSSSSSTSSASSSPDDTDTTSNSVVPASYVFCPDAIGSLGGLNFNPIVNSHRSGSTDEYSGTGGATSFATGSASGAVLTGGSSSGGKNNNQPTLPLLPSTVPDTVNAFPSPIDTNGEDTSKVLTVINTNTPILRSLDTSVSSTTASVSSVHNPLRQSTTNTMDTTTTPPYLLLLVPSDSVQPGGFDMNKLMKTHSGNGPEHSFGTRKDSHTNEGVTTPHVKVQVGNSTVLDNTVVNDEDNDEENNRRTNTLPDTDGIFTGSRSSSPSSSNKKGGWIEVGCEVVSLRHVTGVPTTGRASTARNTASTTGN